MGAPPKAPIFYFIPKSNPSFAQCIEHFFPKFAQCKKHFHPTINKFNDFTQT